MDQSALLCSKFFSSFQNRFSLQKKIVLKHAVTVSVKRACFCCTVLRSDFRTCDAETAKTNEHMELFLQTAKCCVN